MFKFNPGDIVVSIYNAGERKLVLGSRNSEILISSNFKNYLDLHGMKEQGWKIINGLEDLHYYSAVSDYNYTKDSKQIEDDYLHNSFSLPNHQTYNEDLRLETIQNIKGQYIIKKQRYSDLIQEELWENFSLMLQDFDMLKQDFQKFKNDLTLFKSNFDMFKQNIQENVYDLQDQNRKLVKFKEDLGCLDCHVQERVEKILSVGKTVENLI
jgi:hypothetical protein